MSITVLHSPRLPVHFTLTNSADTMLSLTYTSSVYANIALLTAVHFHFASPDPLLVAEFHKKVRFVNMNCHTCWSFFAAELYSYSLHDILMPPSAVIASIPAVSLTVAFFHRPQRFQSWLSCHFLCNTIACPHSATNRLHMHVFLGSQPALLWVTLKPHHVLAIFRLVCIAIEKGQ